MQTLGTRYSQGLERFGSSFRVKTKRSFKARLKAKPSSLRQTQHQGKAFHQPAAGEALTRRKRTQNALRRAHVLDGARALGPHIPVLRIGFPVPD
jgi:hypothetical protein